MEKRGYTISDDCRGAFGSYNVLKRVYGRWATKEAGCMGIEAIGFVWLPLCVALANKAGFQVKIAHGRTGPLIDHMFEERPISNKLKLLGALGIISPTGHLIRQATNLGIEGVLVHAGEANAHYNKFVNYPGTTYIEPDTGRNTGIGACWDLALSMAKAKERLAKPGAVCINTDYVHVAVMYGVLGDVNEAVKVSVTEANMVAARIKGLLSRQNIHIGDRRHVPMGLDASDSLNVQAMSRRSLRMMADSHNEQTEIGIECQNGGFDLVYPMPERVNRAARNARHSMQILSEAGAL